MSREAWKGSERGRIMPLFLHTFLPLGRCFFIAEMKERMDGHAGRINDEHLRQ